MTSFQIPAVADTSVPVADKDRAQTFAESGLTLGHSQTEVSNGSLGLSTSTKRSEINWPNAQSGGSGGTDTYEIVPKYTLTNLSVSFYGYNMTGSTIKDSSGTVISEVTANGPQSHSGLSLLPGETYSLTVSASEGQDHANVTYPRSSKWFDVISGPSTVTASGKIFTTNPPYSGSATVEWAYPDDLYAWDVGVFEANDDDALLEVYLEESSDGGTTWTEIAGPLKRGAALGVADPANNIRYRVDFERSDPTPDPRLHAIYRRYKL